jgi:hypothetical protein
MTAAIVAGRVEYEEMRLLWRIHITTSFFSNTTMTLRIFETKIKIEADEAQPRCSTTVAP